MKFNIKKALTVLSATAILSTSSVVATGIIAANYSYTLKSIINKTGISLKLSDSNIQEISKNNPSLINGGKLPNGMFLAIRVKNIDFSKTIWTEQAKKNSKLDLNWEMNLKTNNYSPSARNPIGNTIYFAKKTTKITKKSETFAYFKIEYQGSTDDGNQDYNSFLQQKLLDGKYQLLIFNKNPDNTSGQMLMNTTVKLKEKDLPKNKRISRQSNNFSVNWNFFDNSNILRIGIWSTNKKLFPTAPPKWEFWRPKPNIYGALGWNSEGLKPISDNTAQVYWNYDADGEGGAGKHYWMYDVELPALSNYSINNLDIYFTFNETGYTVKGELDDD